MKMNETMWLNTREPDFMLRELRDRRLSRKRRLFACACCRRIWGLLAESRCRQAVDVAEEFADGRTGRAELSVSHRHARLAMAYSHSAALASSGASAKELWNYH